MLNIINLSFDTYDIRPLIKPKHSGLVTQITPVPNFFRSTMMASNEQEGDHGTTVRPLFRKRVHGGQCVSWKMDGILLNPSLAHEHPQQLHCSPILQQSIPPHEFLVQNRQLSKLVSFRLDLIAIEEGRAGCTTIAFFCSYPTFHLGHRAHFSWRLRTGVLLL